MGKRGKNAARKERWDWGLNNILGVVCSQVRTHLHCCEFAHECEPRYFVPRWARTSRYLRVARGMHVAAQGASISHVAVQL